MVEPIQMTEEGQPRVVTYADFSAALERLDKRIDKIESEKQQQAAAAAEATKDMWKELDQGNYVSFLCRAVLIQSGGGPYYRGQTLIKIE